MVEKSKFNLFPAYEIGRVSKLYAERLYDQDFSYKPTNPLYLQRSRSVEKGYLQLLNQLNLSHSISSLKILDFGSGNGEWLARWASWGADMNNMSAVDIRDAAILTIKNKYPAVDAEVVGEKNTSFLDGTFDVVFLNLVFSSILDPILRKALACEALRVLKKGGFVFVYDMCMDNPKNPNVMKVTRKMMGEYFISGQFRFQRRVVLAPPLAKIFIKFGFLISDFIESFPFLRTHRIFIIEK